MRGRVRRMFRGSTLFAVAALMGIVTTGALFGYLRQQENPASLGSAAAAAAESAGSSVVVARSDVPAGVTLTDGMLELRSVRASDVAEGALTDRAEAAGHVTLYPIGRNEQVTRSKLAGTSPAGQGLAFSIPADMRAISVPISEVTTAGGLVVPGDRVDVMVLTTEDRLDPSVEPAEDAPDPVVITVIQDAFVLAVAQQTAPPAAPERDPATLRAEEVEPQPGAATATLAVTPDQAQLLFLASSQGTLGLVLRPYGDNSTFPLTPRTRIEVLNEASAAVSAAP